MAKFQIRQTGTELQYILDNALTELLVKITWSELKALRDGSKLVAGNWYRITDYTCTTTQTGTKSAGHVFDVIVRADSENILNEEAFAIQSERDTDGYFANSKLSAWRLWYCLDNDATRFAWADETNGKGVIYRMIDEFNNDVPYDFKNIQFLRKWDSSKGLWSTVSTDGKGVLCYTFNPTGSSSTTSFTDTSLSASNSVYNNTIKEYIFNNKQNLSNNCFFGKYCRLNSFGINCYKNTLGSSCSSILLGIGCYLNSFENNCSSDSLGSGCHDNSFGPNCSSNSLGGGCSDNHFKSGCGSNYLGRNCLSNYFGSSCAANFFGNNFIDNSFGGSCSTNSFGNSCYRIFFGNNCSNNSFGNDCYNVKFASDSSSSKRDNYYKHNHFGDGCQYIVLTGEGTASDNQSVQNYNFAQGTSGTNSVYLTVNGERNRSFETKVAKNSNGELKEYCEADLIL